MATTYYMSGVSLIIQYLTNLGLMAAGGQVNTYVGGSVNTPITTYTDSTGTVANANPMTLSASGRPAAANGAPVAFWVPGGSTVKLVVYDAQGNLLVQLDNIPAVNDPTNVSTSLQALLASPASSNVAGTGPVAGADLVANAVKSYDLYADVRSANVPTLASGQTLNIEVQGGGLVEDGLGGTFYWNSASAAADDAGNTTLKPNGAGSVGRWRRYYGQGVPRSVVKPTDQTLATNIALTNDTALTIPLQSAGSYLVQLRLRLLGTGGTGQGYQVALAFSGALQAPSVGAGVATGNAVASAVTVAVAAALTQAAISSTNGDVVNLDFMLTTTTGGTFTVQFAQNSSSANATTMKAGSALLVTRLA